jgi:mRNA interferase MazF
MPIQRGEVYFVDLGDTIGREQHGIRPVVVMSNDILNRLPLVITIVPGTRGSKVHRDFPPNVRVPAGEANLPEETVFLTFQVRALDHSRFTHPPIGQVGNATLAELEQSVAYTFALSPASSSPSP